MSAKPFSIDRLAAVLDEMGKTYERQKLEAENVDSLLLTERWPEVPWTINVAIVRNNDFVLLAGGQTAEKAVKVERCEDALRTCNDWNFGMETPCLCLEEDGRLRADAPVFLVEAPTDDASLEAWARLFFEALELCFQNAAKKLA